MQNKLIIGLRELRENTEKYIKGVKKGQSFLVLRKSEPIFKICSIQNEENWEEVIDFTKIKKGGVDMYSVLKRL